LLVKSRTQESNRRATPIFTMAGLDLAIPRARVCGRKDALFARGRAPTGWPARRTAMVGKSVVFQSGTTLR
jgi:hypothetical protein